MSTENTAPIDDMDDIDIIDDMDMDIETKKKKKTKTNKKEIKENLHQGHRSRMRQEYILEGIKSFHYHQVLELLLFYSVPRQDTNELAHKMIATFGSFHNLLDADPRDIIRHCNVSEATAVLISLASQIHKKYVSSKMLEKIKFNTSKEVGDYAVSLFKGECNECFFMICFDTQMKHVASEIVANGTIDEAHLYMRQLVEVALKHHASSVVIAHNHPSGNLVASKEDIETTEVVVSVFRQLGIKVIDHIIVSSNSYFSFRENGMV